MDARKTNWKAADIEDKYNLIKKYSVPEFPEDENQIGPAMSNFKILPRHFTRIKVHFQHPIEYWGAKRLQELLN
jgi:hypothetical protein